jgi:hypothetical protein
MLRARQVMGVSQAKKLIEVAASMPREKALEIGAEKAYALARYAAATPEPDTPAWLLDGDAAIGGKPVRDLSLRELQAATSKVRSKHAAKKATPEEHAARASARDVQAWLKKRGAKGAAVTARKTKDGWWLTIEVRADAAKLLAGG